MNKEYNQLDAVFEQEFREWNETAERLIHIMRELPDHGLGSIWISSTLRLLQKQYDAMAVLRVAGAKWNRK